MTSRHNFALRARDHDLEHTNMERPVAPRNISSNSTPPDGLGRVLEGGTVFYLIHGTAIVSLIVSFCASTAVLVYFARKSAGVAFSKRKISERLVVYLAVCDLLWSIDHIVDHLYQVITLRMPPDPVCVTTAFFLQGFANAQSLIVAFTAINAWILVVKEKRISLGRGDWRLLLVAFGVPTIFGVICGALGYLGPSEAWCMADMRKREGQIINMLVTFLMLAVFIVDIVAYTLVWIKIRQTGKLMKNIGNSNNNNNAMPISTNHTVANSKMANCYHSNSTIVTNNKESEIKRTESVARLKSESGKCKILAEDRYDSIVPKMYKAVNESNDFNSIDANCNNNANPSHTESETKPLSNLPCSNGAPSNANSSPKHTVCHNAYTLKPQHVEQFSVSKEHANTTTLQADAETIVPATCNTTSCPFETEPNNLPEGDLSATRKECNEQLDDNGSINNKTDDAKIKAESDKNSLCNIPIEDGISMAKILAKPINTAPNNSDSSGSIANTELTIVINTAESALNIEDVSIKETNMSNNCTNVSCIELKMADNTSVHSSAENHSSKATETPQSNGETHKGVQKKTQFLEEPIKDERRRSSAFSGQVRIFKRLQSWRDKRHQNNEKSKYAKAAKTMSLFVLAYITQWSAFMVYSIWSLFNTPHYSIVFLGVLFCNAGGVMNCLVYTVMRREQSSQNKGQSLKKLTAGTLQGMTAAGSAAGKRRLSKF